MSKKALVVGINEFTRPDWALRGCVNDTIAMEGLLKTYFGFVDDDIKIVRDKEATKKGIQEGLEWLLSDYDGDGSDVRVFDFSSHGTYVDDQGHDELEGFDEVIVPHDHDWDAPFRDDDLWDYFQAIPENVNFTFIADCCHSGTIQKVARGIEFTPRQQLPPKDIAEAVEELKEERYEELEDYVAAHMARMLQGVPVDQWPAKMKEFRALLIERFKAEKGYGVLHFERHFLLAGCESDQTSADARIEGTWRGAMTWGLGKAIVESNGDLTYEELIKRIGANIKDYDQRPQLECPDALRAHKIFAPLA
jgi:hypothetical protein